MGVPVKILMPERSIKLSSLIYCIYKDHHISPAYLILLFLYDLKIDNLVKLEKEAATWVSGFHMVVCKATRYHSGK